MLFAVSLSRTRSPSKGSWVRATSFPCPTKRYGMDENIDEIARALQATAPRDQTAWATDVCMSWAMIQVFPAVFVIE
jgi:predicted signal transduction protein with EAL and GGDEF domain